MVCGERPLEQMPAAAAAADLRTQLEDWGKPTSFGASTSFAGVAQSLKVVDSVRRQPAAAPARGRRDWAAPAQEQLSKSQQRRRFRCVPSHRCPARADRSLLRGAFLHLSGDLRCRPPTHRAGTSAMPRRPHCRRRRASGGGSSTDRCVQPPRSRADAALLQLTRHCGRLGTEDGDEGAQRSTGYAGQQLERA